MMASLRNKVIVLIFHSGYFDCRGAFEHFLIRTAILFCKKVNKQVHKTIGIFNYSMDHSTLIKSTETNWSSAWY